MLNISMAGCGDLELRPTTLPFSVCMIWPDFLPTQSFKQFYIVISLKHGACLCAEVNCNGGNA